MQKEEEVNEKMYRWRIDDRERDVWSAIQSQYQDLSEDVKVGIGLELTRLDSGDFHFLNPHGECLLWIERKRWDDLISSINDGRYQKQKELARQWKNGHPNCRIIWLVEGNHPKTEKDIFRSHAVLWKVILREQDIVWWSPSDKQTAADFIHLAKQSNINPTEWSTIWTNQNQQTKQISPNPSQDDTKILLQAGGKRAKNSEEAWARMLYTIPNMPSAIIQLIIQNYPTPVDFFREVNQKIDEQGAKSVIAEWSNLPNGSRRWGKVGAHRLFTWFGWKVDEVDPKEKIDLKCNAIDNVEEENECSTE